MYLPRYPNQRCICICVSARGLVEDRLKKAVVMPSNVRPRAMTFPETKMVQMSLAAYQVPVSSSSNGSNSGRSSDLGSLLMIDTRVPGITSSTSKAFASSQDGNVRSSCELNSVLSTSHEVEYLC